jgi:multiple sugar transport system substrate-binding protein
VYDDPQLQQQYPYFAPVAESWREYGIPVFRPRFAEWPQISEVIAQVGSEMQLGSVSIEDGVAQIEEQMREILQPYYNGEKPLAQ